MQKYTKKASGWITLFLDDFFLEQIGRDNTMTIYFFRNYIKNKENKSKLLHSFRINFPEIYYLIEYLYDII